MVNYHLDTFIEKRLMYFMWTLCRLYVSHAQVQVIKTIKDCLNHCDDRKISWSAHTFSLTLYDGKAGVPQIYHNGAKTTGNSVEQAVVVVK